MSTTGTAKAASLGARTSSLMDHVEGAYLKVLRAAILMIATLLLVYATWLGISSLYKISRSPDAVVEKVAVVEPHELTDAETARIADPGSPSVTQAEKSYKRYYQGFAKRYYALFRSKFEPFRQGEDKQLSLEQFDDAFIKTEERIRAVTDGSVAFDQDKADLESLLSTMTQASDKPKTQERLKKYRSAKKVEVTKSIQRTRTERRRGWNSYSTDCYQWYLEPVGCAENRSVQVPYTEKASSMEYPSGTQSHTQIFRAYQDRFFQLLESRRRTNAAAADSERADITAGIISGKLTLWTTLSVLAAFVVLMFFFLLIAIERHQRRLAAALPKLAQEPDLTS
jgi:Na+-transporting methylmalonyl-CoA/oxaloacetate decarboxylase gamma subunit